MKVLIAAGGSGGHIFPAIALGRALKKLDQATSILYVGSDKALDRRIFQREGAAFTLLSANKLPYSLSWQIAGVMGRLLLDIVRSFMIVWKFKPQAVVGFGGYVSFPVTVAACALGVPRVVHEQNVIPGRANAILFRVADSVAMSFDETRAFLLGSAPKAVLTGNPIRTEMFTVDRDHGIKRFGLDRGKFTVLVIGGSQGAANLNRTFVASLEATEPGVRNSIQVIHITGVADYEWAIREYEDLKIDYRVHSFVDRIEEAYGAADLVVTRSGSSALFELAYLGKPLVLIPYPYAASHQRENALAFSTRGAAVMIEEKDLSAERFRDVVIGLFRDPEKRTRLGEAARGLGVPDAALRLAKEVTERARR